MYNIPTEVVIDGQSYTIRNGGDYRVVLDCFSVFTDPEIDNDLERGYIALLVFYDCFEGLEDLLSCGESTVTKLNDEMQKFMNCGQTESPGHVLNYKLYNWDDDSQLICAAINNVAHFEIRAAEYVHWWTFLGYFSSIGKSTFSTVVGIRDKIKKGKKLEKYENEFRQNNPQYFAWDSRTTQQAQDDEWLLSVWNNDKAGE